MQTLTGALIKLTPGGDFDVKSDDLPLNADAYDASVDWRGPGDKPTWDELLAYFAELERPTAEAQRAAAYALAARMHADFLNHITGDATTEERDTWPAKAEAARAHLAGVASAAQSDILDGETQDGARSKDELASVILTNDKRYRPFAGRARAVLSAHNTAISDAPGLDIETTLETARADCAAAYAGLLIEFASEDAPEIDVSDTLEARVKALEEKLHTLLFTQSTDTPPQDIADLIILSSSAPEEDERLRTLWQEQKHLEEMARSYGDMATAMTHLKSAERFESAITWNRGRMVDIVE